MKIIATSPCRISFFGGGTDTNPYAEKYGGVCINMAITLRQKFVFDGEGSKIDILGVNKFHEAFLGKGIYGLKQTCNAKLEAGLGTSASAAVALNGIWNKTQNIQLSRKSIADIAWSIEVYLLKLFGGRQDQYASSLGGCNIMKFSKGVKVKSVSRKRAEGLAKHTMLFYTGSNRRSTKIQEEFKKLDNSQMVALNDLKRVVNQAIDSLTKRNYTDLGHLLAVSWHYKKMSNSKITTPHIDNIYNIAMKMGAWGGKICGSGGGGYMIFMASKDDRKRIIHRLEEHGVKHIPFKIDWKGLVVK